VSHGLALNSSTLEVEKPTVAAFARTANYLMDGIEYGRMNGFADKP
jgi:hypothetical protein